MLRTVVFDRVNGGPGVGCRGGSTGTGEVFFCWCLGTAVVAKCCGLPVAQLCAASDCGQTHRSYDTLS